MIMWNYKTFLDFPGSRIFSLFPEFQLILDFLKFQKKVVCHPCTLYRGVRKNQMNAQRKQKAKEGEICGVAEFRSIVYLFDSLCKCHDLVLYPPAASKEEIFTFMIIYSTLTHTCVKLLSMYVQYILQFLLQFLKADK